MNTRSKHEIDMTHGSIFPKLMIFALPLALSGLLQLTFNAADIIVLGRFVGSDALAAVGSTGALNGLFVNFFLGISVGVNVVVATNYAAGKYNEVSQIVHTSIALALVCGVIMTLLGLSAAVPLLKLIGSPEEVLPLSATYMRIYFLGVPFILLYNFGSAALRSVGDTTRPLYYLTVAGVSNVILNLLFTIVFKMGVAGVAIATTASNMISSMLVLRALIKEDSCLHLDLRKLNLDGKTILKFARVGIPAGIQSILFNVSNILIQSSVNSFGAVVMAGNSASGNIEGFQYTVMHCFYTAAITFIGQNIGARKYSRLNKIVYSCLLSVLLVSAAFMAPLSFFGRNLLGLYTMDPAVVDAGMIRLGLFTKIYFLCGLMDVSAASLRGMGYGTLPTLITLFGAVGIRVIWIFTVFARYHDYRLLLVGYPVSWAITFVIGMIAYYFARSKLPKEDGPEPETA